MKVYPRRTKLYPEPGQVVPIVGNWSEATHHLGLSDRPIFASLTPGPHPMAQLYDESRRPVSFPVTTGEGGFIWDDARRAYYTYPRED